MQQLITVTAANPCPHCGKPDWCYRLGELTVCKRGADPADGWKETGKQDSEGSPYYARVTKQIRPRQERYWEYPDREGNRLVRVRREDDGEGKKAYRQESWDGRKWVTGLKGIGRTQIPIYRYAEIQQAINAGKQIFIVEGEVCADVLWQLGLPATCNIGGSKKFRASDAADLEGAEDLVICPDRDEKGIEHARAIAEFFPNAKWLYAFPNSRTWFDLPPSNGLDLADWIADFALEKTEILKAVEPQVRDNHSLTRTRVEESLNIVNTTPETTGGIEIEQSFTQKAEEALYSDRWIALNGVLYRWTGTHYELQPEAVEKKRISEWCNAFAEMVKGRWRYTRANSTSIEAVYSWIVGRLGIDPSAINPPGLNCKNGVLRIKWKATDGYPIAHWRLDRHDPNDFYIYCSEIEYQPDCDPADCDRLLEALDPPQRRIFLQTIAASLDLPTVRRYRGRMIKALLCYGTGSNGKDALRSALACVLGSGMSNASLSDFQAYDQGRKFSLAKLEGALCNWASENTSFASLDTIQSIKQFITGDPLDIERKFKDAYEITPSAVGLFNCNAPPSLQGGLEAVQSRWAVISFSKTFKHNADPSKGELEADPRFKYDPDYIREKVSPALLNRMLETLKTLIRDGIDFEATEEAFQEIQESSCHLWQFCRESGLKYEINGRVYVVDLWQRLKDWYIDTGTLEIEETSTGKEKLVWQEFTKKSDRPVKAINQVFARFSELYPKIQRMRDTSNSPRKGQWMLLHLEFQNSIIVGKNGAIASPILQDADTASNTENFIASPVLHHCFTDPNLNGGHKVNQTIDTQGSEATKPVGEAIRGGGEAIRAGEAPVKQSEAIKSAGEALKPLHSAAVKQGEAISPKNNNYFSDFQNSNDEYLEDESHDLDDEVSDTPENERPFPQVGDRVKRVARRYWDEHRKEWRFVSEKYAVVTKVAPNGDASTDAGLNISQHAWKQGWFVYL